VPRVAVKVSRTDALLNAHLPYRCTHKRTSPVQMHS
jgi:hypothetical protein